MFRSALASLQAGKANDAERLFKKLLSAQPEHVAGLNLLAILLTKLGRFEEAERYAQRALDEDATSDATFYNYGIILKSLKRPTEALERFSQALAINASISETWNNRGTIFSDLKQYREAVADFDKAISINSNYPDAYCNKGKSLAELKLYDESLGAFNRALSLKSDLAEAWLGRGNVFFKLKRNADALVDYDKALSIKPDFAEAWLGRGHVFVDLKRFNEAFAAYDKAFTINPDLNYLEGARLHAKMQLCDWSDYDAESEHLILSIRSGKLNTAPFTLLAIPSSSADQLQCAKLWVADKCPPSRKSIWQGEHYRHDRIRVAYVSADFREHPVSFLLAGMFESHDKSRFDITAISLGSDDNTEMRQRLKESVGHFIDVKAHSDDQIADIVKSSEADILVDLMGFTAESRTGIFARCAAPIQVNYLGYPGTMGANYIDYVIADSILIPASHQNSYTEKIVYLPNSYQGNDTKRNISKKIFTRAECGLPDSGFVFCCFNNSYKILPSVFDRWMRILLEVPGGVLWLLEDNATAVINLKREAELRGISAERLVFAKRMSLPDHLARHRLADLFLDTLPYNAHTTASDALWAGLPVLTQIGEAFAGRVAASLLSAIGLPELIIETSEEYVQLAIDLAKHPEKLAAIKHKLAENRLTAPLFDTKLFTKHIESAYTAMYEQHRRGDKPKAFAVEPIS